MQMLALYAVIYSLSFNAGDIYKATGRPAILNKIAIIKLTITIPVLWITAGYGILYVALGQLLSTVILTLLRLIIVTKILSLRPGMIFRAVKPAVISTCVMYLGLVITNSQIHHFDNILQLLILLCVGVLFYLGMLWVTDRSVILQAKKFIFAKKIESDEID